MSYSKLIHDYLDGGIDSTQEAMLFDMLSKDSELRADFNKQMKLHLIAQQDMNHISPPAEATNELFGRLGFTVPDYLETPAPSVASKVTGYIKKYGFMALLLLLTSALSVVMTSNYDNWFGDEKQVATEQSSVNNIPTVSSFENDNIDAETENLNQNNNTTNQSSVFAESLGNKSGLGSNRNNLAQNLNANNNNGNLSANADSGSEISHDSDAKQNILDKISSWFTSKPDYVEEFDTPNLTDGYGNGSRGGTLTQIPAKTFASSITLPSFGDDEDTSYEFGFKYSTDASNNDYSHLAINSQFYDNLIFAGMYHLNEYHSVGVELGWERFAQSFVTNYYGELTEQKQYPRRFLAGLTYRFTYTNLFGTEFISPYTELFTGGSSLGPISKLNAGISLTPLNNFSMNIGYEYGVLYYSVDNKTYNSEKQGFVYRVSYNF